MEAATLAMGLSAIVRGTGEGKSFVGKTSPVSRSGFDEFNCQKRLDGRARENSRIHVTAGPDDRTICIHHHRPTERP